MLIKGSEKSEYEKVTVDEWLNARICGWESRMREKEWKGQKKVVEECRLKLEIEGYSEFHYSRWYTAILSENSNLYKFLLQLDPSLKPNENIESDSCVNLRVKVMYAETPRKDGQGMYQYLDRIKPLEPFKFQRVQVEKDTIPQKEVVLEPPF